MKKIILAGSLFALSLSSYSEKIISNNNQQKETKKMGTMHMHLQLALILQVGRSLMTAPTGMMLFQTAFVI